MRPALAHCLAALGELYPQPPMTEPRLNAFGMALADLTDAECERAFLVLSRESGRRFYPSPGDIAAAARPTLTPGALATLFDRIEAAILFRKANLSRIAEEFGVAAMEAVQAAGGIDAIRSPGEFRSLRLKEFAAAYRETATMEPEKLAPPEPVRMPRHVAGLVESVSRGMALPKGDR